MASNEKEETKIDAPFDSVKQFDNEIEKIPEFEFLPVHTERDQHFHKQKCRAVVETKSNDAIAVVSPTYVLVQMRDNLGKVLSLFTGENIGGTIYYFRGYGQLRIFPSDSDIGIAVVNSVNGGSAIKVQLIKQINGATAYLPTAVCPEEVKKYKKLHVGRPLDEVVNFSKILADAQATWGFIETQISKTPLTKELLREVTDCLDTKMLIDAADQFANGLDKHLGRQPTLWDLLLVIFKTAAGSTFKSDIHRERRLQELSTMLIALALKAS